MNYELAKQLKDAGFLQSGSGEHRFQYPPIEVNNFSRSDMTPDSSATIQYYVPTLSELIEACGEDFKSLHFLSPIWSAEAINQRYECGGKTPDEAVAKLWLALNTNK